LGKVATGEKRRRKTRSVSTIEKACRKGTVKGKWGEESGNIRVGETSLHKAKSEEIGISRPSQFRDQTGGDLNGKNLLR